VSRKRIIIALLILLLYLCAVVALVVISYRLSPPTNTDQYKEFGVRAGIALTATSAFFATVIALFSLSTQIKAAHDLEEKKKEIVLAVETHKNELQGKLEEYKGELLLGLEQRKRELQEQIEEVKGSIVRQNDFLSRTLNVKSVALDKLFVASNNCYRELQNLERGLFDEASVDSCERSLREAEGLAANLDAEGQAIVKELVQMVFNIVDSAKEVKGNAEEKKVEYRKVWEKYVQQFGEAMENLRKRSLFHDKSTDVS
jgi:hypothetical protein